ncbi:MAG TPA: class I SAM-dependent methyltransferase [Ohtaekwangia sp.]|uniref:class I SAM-dependent methyltransferase n=1 Tax=Ohtaekwangia sp. TaxID=2066019 RepID=UPI002F94A87D
MISVTNCPICGNSTFYKHLNCKDYTVSHESFEIIKCSNCSFHITSPRPDDSTIGSYYLSESYISHNNKAQGILDRLYLLARKYTLQWKLSLLQTYNQNSEKTLLDYGSGTGAFLEACSKNGWQTTGIEPSENARKASKYLQLSVYQSINQINSNKFNSITLWHVLEHVPDLDVTLQQLKSLLSDKGTLFIAVPNFQSSDGQHYKEYWAGYDVPRHLWHFSRENMNQLMQKNGLSIINIIPMKLDAYYISLLSEKYKSPTSGLPGMILAFKNAMLSNLRAKKTGQYSSLIYIIRK